jgi:hypothetical protein
MNRKERSKAVDKEKKGRIDKRNENVNADITKKKEAFQTRMDKQRRVCQPTPPPPHHFISFRLPNNAH